jgi:UDP-glucose:(heptosyl)LPS alpha-1,3-glucosyltransferase
MTARLTLLKSHFTHRGGAEKHARLLAQAFHEKGCELTVLTTEPVIEPFPFEVVALTPQSLTSVSKIWEFEAFCSEYVKKHPADIVFGMDRNRFQTHLRAGSGVHRAYLDHRRGYEPFWKRLRHRLNPLHTTLLHLEKAAFEHHELQLLFVNSNMVKEELLTHYNVAPEKICVIHNGVEWSALQESFDSWQEHKDPNGFTFLFLGSGFERKGLRPLLFALQALDNTDVQLDVVGDDPKLKQFEQLAYSLGLSQQVTFHGRQNAIHSFLQKADTLVLPTYYDPFANATIEALAMGLFVLTSKTNGGSEVLTEESGYLFESMDPYALKEGLQVALEHPKTATSALTIRQSVQHLELSNQLHLYLDKCLQPIS